MIRFRKTLLVSHSARQMFDLVNDIPSYPEFLPWCSEAVVLEEQGNQKIARLGMRYLGLKQSFSTINLANPPHSLILQLKEGPFRYLKGEWVFSSIDEESCQIIFSIEYDFDSKLLQKLIGPVFDVITKTLVDAFVKRADKIAAKR
ncbi:MAG: type II toxin-antitoxin system RatA family toxin [Pseudomonadota bacterium]